MTKDETGKLLLDATIRLIKNAADIDNITSRDIVAEAGVNLAMINYCYGSKDELISLAVNSVIENDFSKLWEEHNMIPDARQQLYHILSGICETVAKYEKISRMSMPYLLLESKIEVPLKILPLVQKIYKDKRTEEECKVIAYQLISSLQLMLYQNKNFCEYSGMDLTRKDVRERLYAMEMRIFFGE